MKKYKLSILIIIILIILNGCSSNEEELNEENIVETTEKIEDTSLEEAKDSDKYLIEDDINIKIKQRMYSIGDNTLNIEIPIIEDSQYKYSIFSIDNLNNYIEKCINNLAGIYKLINYETEDNITNIEISNYEVLFKSEDIVSLKFLYKKDGVENLKGITLDLKNARILNLFNIISAEELENIIENNEFEIIGNNFNENNIKESVKEILNLKQEISKTNFFLKNDGLYIIISENTLLKILDKDSLKEKINRISEYINERKNIDIIEVHYNENSYFLTNNIWIEEIEYFIGNNKVISRFPIIINGSKKLNSSIKETIDKIINFEHIKSSYNDISDYEISDFNLFFKDEERLNFTFSLYYYYGGTPHPTIIFYELIIDLKNEDVEVVELGLLRDLSAEDYKKIFGETDYYKERYSE